jgi:hypothetical protein
VGKRLSLAMRLASFAKCIGDPFWDLFLAKVIRPVRLRTLCRTSSLQYSKASSWIRQLLFADAFVLCFSNRSRISLSTRKSLLAFVSLEDLHADIPVSCSPEAVFDIQWALTITEEAVRRLREECESKGQRWLYEALVRYLDVDRTEVCYRTISAQLRIPEKTVKQLLHQFRNRFRGLLKEEVAKTVENSADVQDEIRYLCEALASASNVTYASP